MAYLILLTGAVEAGARERLLMDRGWRFTNGDPSEVSTALDYPEAADLTKVRVADLQNQAKIAAGQVDAAKSHLGEGLTYVQPTFDDTAWRPVDLPHDWVVELPFNPKANEYHGFKDIDKSAGTNIGWYRRSFDLSTTDKGKIISIEFDGIYRNSLVWLNGHCLGRHPSGYTSFAYDITQFANFGGRNVLAVRADATRNEGWFYEGAGIYRHAWLVKTDPVHVAHWGTFVTTVS